MALSARAKGYAENLSILVAGVVVVAGLLLGLTLAFASPLPPAAWAGLGVVLAVALALVGLAFAIVVRSDRAAPEPAERMLASAAGPSRILVLADETIGSRVLRREVCDRAAGADSEVLVVAPALNTPIRHWTGEDDRARAQAQARLEEELGVLAGLGVRASGTVGADDPLQAVDDALRTFPADEIVISTHPLGRSNWLEEDVVGRIREAYGLPVTHVTGG